MFMYTYTVSPRADKQRRKSFRRVEPISRIKPTHRAGYSGAAFPLQQIENPREITGSQSQTYDEIYEKLKMESERNNWKQQTGELYIQNILPLLLVWRYPKTAISPDYIQKYRDRLFIN